MYRAAPTASEIAGFGFVAEDLEDETVVWPDNEKSVEVFIVMRRQWRYSFGGAAGLDFGTLPEVWERLRVKKRKHRDQIFADLQVLQDAALAAMHPPKQ
jgi:hypothetical protein